MMVFSRLAKLMSHARVISLTLPVARPRMSAMDATGKRVRRTRKSGQGGKPVVPSGSEVRSSILAVKSESFRKYSSTALSKTTTLACSSASRALMTSWNCLTISGPMTLIGGLSIVTRQ
jgi:hypothetical protein